MYDRTLNQSRTSLTTNSSRATRIVRKRDSNFSINLVRSRSKNKQDQCNTSFEEYLSKHGVGVVDPEAKNKCKEEGKSEYAERTVGSAPLGLSNSLSTAHLSKTAIIQRGDRYINSRPILQPAACSTAPQQKQQKTSKKRSPTPVKSKKELSYSSPGKNQEKAVANSNRIFQLELRIAGLEQNLNIERSEKQKLQKKYKDAVIDVQNLRQILSQVEMQNKILESERKACEQKIQKLQKAMLQSQSNLTTAHNNLNKLRQTIKQNRLTQLQSQTKRLQKTIQSLQSQTSTIPTLSQKLSQITKEYEEYRKQTENMQQKSIKQQYLNKQLERCKKQIEIYKGLSCTQKELFLEDTIKEQEKEIQDLKGVVDMLMVKLSCMEYKRNKEVCQLRQSSQSEIKALRKYEEIRKIIKQQHQLLLKLHQRHAQTTTQNANAFHHHSIMKNKCQQHNQVVKNKTMIEEVHVYLKQEQESWAEQEEAKMIYHFNQVQNEQIFPTHCRLPDILSS